jgi:hypothetical protein
MWEQSRVRNGLYLRRVGMVEMVLFEEATVLSCIDEGGSMIGERRWRFASLISEKVFSARALGGARAPTILTL